MSFLLCHFVHALDFTYHEFVLYFDLVNTGLVKQASFFIFSDYRQKDRDRSPAEAKDFSSSLCVQTSSEAHPALYPMYTGFFFRGGKFQLGCDADHSPSSSAEVKNE
jgi:hypothetical protein